MLLNGIGFKQAPMALFQKIELLHPTVTPTEIHAAFSEAERMSRDVNTITLPGSRITAGSDSVVR
jgi:hypothetical protein